MAHKKVHLKLTAAQHRDLLKALGGKGLGDVHTLDDIQLYVEPGHFGGNGFWSDLGKEVKKIRKSDVVRGLVHRAEHIAPRWGRHRQPLPPKTPSETAKSSA